MLDLPYIETLFRNYAYGTVEEVAKKIGGTVERNLMNPKFKAYKDTCAIRVSRALNYSGRPIPWKGGGVRNPRTSAAVRTDQGGDKKHYIFSTSDMRIYLNARYGVAKKYSASTTWADLKHNKGIIAFGFLHIDLWNGEKCAKRDYFLDQRINEILLWETMSIFDHR